VKTEQGIVIGIGVLAIVAASMAIAQAPAAPSAQVLLSSGGLASFEKQAQEEIVREIDDPHTGDRWLLMRDGRFPGGPGRLVLAEAHRNVTGASGRAAGQPDEAQLIPVIHTGDRLIVEEHTAIVDAVLEARALNPATAGAQLEVRLTIGGNVLRVMALGPGRAALIAETGKRP
jgi:hypothetical protein